MSLSVPSMWTVCSSNDLSLLNSQTITDRSANTEDAQ